MSRFKNLSWCFIWEVSEPWWWRKLTCLENEVVFRFYVTRWFFLFIFCDIYCCKGKKTFCGSNRYLGLRLVWFFTFSWSTLNMMWSSRFIVELSYCLGIKFSGIGISAEVRARWADLCAAKTYFPFCTGWKRLLLASSSIPFLVSRLLIFVIGQPLTKWVRPLQLSSRP